MPGKVTISKCGKRLNAGKGHYKKLAKQEAKEVKPIDKKEETKQEEK